MTSDTAPRPVTPEPHDPGGLALEKSAAARAERCTGCGNPLALDQRYCLNCGKRRGSTRIDFENYIDNDGPKPQQPATAYVPPPPVDDRPIREVTPLMAATGLIGLAVILILGVLIGRTGQASQAPVQTPVLAATTTAPTTTGTTTAATATSDTNVSFTADWPSGKDGYTIELATLPKDTTDAVAVETAKSDLLAKGATDVGALDSDEYASLDPNTYVLYSGVYDTKAEADKALAPVKAVVPEALVVEVSSSAGGGGGGTTKVASGGLGDNGATTPPDQVVQASSDDLKALSQATGDAYEEAQKKLPPTIQTPGEAPPKDNKAPGGGSGDAVTIG